jgi:hypothetical protein
MPGTDFAIRNQDYVRQQAAQPVAAAKADESVFGFDDLIDIVNPLQHIPVISTLYKHLTGDKIGVPEKIAGDALYGGLVGFFCSVGDALFTAATGKSVGDTVYSAVFGNDEESATAVAANDNEPATVVAANDVPASDLSTPNQASMTRAAAAYRASGRLLEAY